MSLSKSDKQRVKAEALYNEAIHFGNMGGDPAQEIKMLNKVIAVYPSAYWAYVTKAAMLNFMAQNGAKDAYKLTGEAKTCLEIAFAMKPDSPQVVYSKWKSEHKDASPQEIAVAMNQVLKLPAVTLRDHIAFARAYEALGREDLQLEQYQRLAQMPEYAANFEIWNNLGDLLYNADRYAEAVVAYEYVVRIEKKSAKGWHDLGYLLARQGKHNEAESPYRTSVKLAPKDIDYLDNFAVCLDVLEKYDESIAIRKQMLKLDPTNAKAHYGIAVSIKGMADDTLKTKPKAYKKELEKALSESDKALAQDPDNILFLTGKADVLICLERSAEALELILKADVLFRHMDAGVKADFSNVLSFIESVLGKQADLVAELHISPTQLQEMIAVFDPHHDSSASGSPAGSGHGELVGDSEADGYGSP